MFKKIITAKKFWISVLVLMLVFIVLFNLIRIFIEYKFDFSGYFEFYFQSNRLPSFIVANLIGGFFYGFVMAFYRYWRYFKNDSPEKKS